MQFKQKEEFTRLKERLTDIQTAEKVSEVTYKLMLKDVLQYRPPYPTDLVQLEEQKEFTYPKPGDFGEVEYYRDFNFTSTKQEPKTSKKKGKGKKGKK